jgi:cell division septum initiation protein DivIVA
VTAWWNEGSPRLDPQTIGNVDFPQAKGLRKGLDPDAVHAYLRQTREIVAKEIGTLISERNSWYQQADELRRRVIGGSEVAEVDPVALWTRVAAQQEADKLIAQTMAWCGQLTDEARERRDGILASAAIEAARQAEEILTRARQAASAAASAALEHPQATPEAGQAATAAELAYYRAYASGLEHLRLVAQSLIRSLEAISSSGHGDLTAVLQAADRRGELL